MIEPVQLGREFAKELEAQLGLDTLYQIVELNSAETDSEICHLHDFCDANQVVLDAMEKFGMDFEIKLIPFLNEVWSITKTNQFWIDAPTEDGSSEV